MKAMIIAASVFALSVLVTLVTHIALAHAGARPGLHWGPAKPFGSGTARAWVAVDMDGQASQLGVSIDPAALESARLGRDTEAVLPLPVSSGIRAASAGPARGPAFRVRYDDRSRQYVVVLEGVQAMPELTAAR